MNASRFAEIGLDPLDVVLTDAELAGDDLADLDVEALGLVGLEVDVAEARLIELGSDPDRSRRRPGSPSSSPPRTRASPPPWCRKHSSRRRRRRRNRRATSASAANTRSARRSERFIGVSFRGSVGKDLGQEVLGARALRMVEELGGRAALDDPTLVHEDDPVARPCGRTPSRGSRRSSSCRSWRARPSRRAPR